MADERHVYMGTALDLGEHAVGRTSPNPPVGAVVVRDGAIVGRGWTQTPGGPHAEVVALRDAGDRAHGADLFVTLEPCTFWGRTPPCTGAIIDAGIRRVYYAAPDPDRRIGTGAAAALRPHDIEATYLPDPTGRADELLAAFRCRVERGRPLVTAKYAMTLDGRIATVTGDSKWITAPLARRRVHELRDRVDAIMVGINTVLADDPALTTRLDDHWRPVRHPLRVVVDSAGRTPLGAQLVGGALPGQTLIATVRGAREWQDALRSQGNDVALIDADPQGRLNLPSLLQELARRGCNSVLVEGGATLTGALFDGRLIERVWSFIAPKLIGGARAPGPVGGKGIAVMGNAITTTVLETAKLDDDLLIVARLTYGEDDHVHRDR